MQLDEESFGNMLIFLLLLLAFSPTLVVRFLHILLHMV
jgi:hypothetical protein